MQVPDRGGRALENATIVENSDKDKMYRKRTYNHKTQPVKFHNANKTGKGKHKI